MKKMQEKSKRYNCTRQITTSPLKPSHRDDKHQGPPAKRQRRIEGFVENVVQLPLCVNRLHLYLSLLNMVSQKVMSHFNVFGFPVENWVMG
jgi:hypothetical protein